MFGTQSLRLSCLSDLLTLAFSFSQLCLFMDRSVGLYNKANTSLILPFTITLLYIPVLRSQIKVYIEHFWGLTNYYNNNNSSQVT